MGHGYWILLWDGYGSGLVLINPRLHAEGLDQYGNPNNCWPCTAEEVGNEDLILKRHGFEYYPDIGEGLIVLRHNGVPVAGGARVIFH